MKKAILFSILIAIAGCVSSQIQNSSMEGTTGQQNINSIIKLAPYSNGTVGFDNRYEGVKGSPRLFEKLMPSVLRVKDQDYYIKLETDLDIERNTLLFTHPKTGKLLSIPSDIVVELIVTDEAGNDLTFRTIEGMTFEKEIKENRFIQILSESPYLFIKMCVKTFLEADYKGLYSADRPYDEYEIKIRYYIAGTDAVLRQVQLNRNSLIKLFPDKKEIIKKNTGSGSFKNDEEMVISLLEKL